MAGGAVVAVLAVVVIAVGTRAGTGSAPDAAPSATHAAAGLDGAPAVDEASATLPADPDAGRATVIPPGGEAPPLALPGSLPQPESATGRMVDAFPGAVVPVMSGATVLSSGVDVAGQHLLVTLKASTPVAASKVAGFYSAKYGGLGFVEAEATARKGATARTFTRGEHSLLVSVRRDGDDTLFSIVGALAIAG